MVELLIIILIVVFLVYLARRNSPSHKGKKGELRVARTLSKLPAEYQVLNDLVFQTNNGTTQIDHVVVSKYGVFAIETKNYRGEIYGDDNRKEWTQIIVTHVTYRRKWWKTYTYVTKNHLYNPVKQSIGHAFRIKEILSMYPHLKIVPVVVFVGDASLGGVETRHHVIFESDLLPVIKDYQTVYLKDADVKKVANILEQHNVRMSVSDKQHVKNLRAAERKANDTINRGICPRCGGQLVERKGRYGTFYGCSRYPACKFTTQ